MEIICNYMLREWLKMEYNVYCDESCHLKSNECKYMLIGAVYCPKRMKCI